MYWSISSSITEALNFLLIVQVFPGEPVYAQVNRDKKKNSRNQHLEGPDAMNAGYHQHQLPPHHQHANYAEHAELWQQQQAASPRPGQPVADAAAGGDSWVWSYET